MAKTSKIKNKTIVNKRKKLTWHPKIKESKIKLKK